MYKINQVKPEYKTLISLTEFVSLVCLCIYLPDDDDFVVAETCRRYISDK